MSSSLVIFTKLANFVNMSTKCYREGVLEDFRLRIFMAVAEKGSFTLAAKALGVSQPAVSQNIAELEKSLGAELFLRRKGSVTLTPKGAAFKEYAGRILYWYTATEMMFGPEGKLSANKPVRLSADGFIASHILPQALSKLLAFNSSLTFFIRSESSGNDSDIRIYAQRHVTEPSFEDIDTFLFSVTASAVSSNPAYSKTTDLKALPQSARLAVPKIYSEILPLDLKARVAVVSDSAEAIVELVTDSPDIIGLLPLPAVPTDLTILPITLPSLALDVHLQTPEGPNPIATALRRILCDQFPA